MKIAICDNNIKFINDISKKLKSMSFKDKIPFVILTYTNPYELLAYYSNYKDIDIIILELEIKLKDGYEVASEIKRIDSKIKIILVSEIGTLAIKGYSIHATQFLLKPIKQVYLMRILEEIVEDIRKEDRNFFINRTVERIDKIYCSEIVYIETSGRHTLIHTTEGIYESYITMRKHMETLANMGFKQSHSAYIVNLNFIKSIKDNMIELRNGEYISLSQGRKKVFLKAVEDYYTEIENMT